MSGAYLDNAASTRLDERVLDAMRPLFLDTYAVATSEFGHSAGIAARDSLEAARASLAAMLGAAPEEFIFTSGSAESSNLALKGAAAAMAGRKPRRVVVSAIEDFPVLHSASALQKAGFELEVVPVDGEGFVDPGRLKEALARGAAVVSVQHANQEIGTVQDAAALARVCKEAGALFHCDATHSFRRVPLDLRGVPADLVTVSAHTIHGPKGAGGLFVRKGTPLVRQMDGGFQEFELRGGLENIPAAAGFARAAELADPQEAGRLAAMRDRLIGRILAEVPDTTLNGPRAPRSPQNANLTFHFVEGESITLHLDMRGFAVSTGSACFSRSLEASHVIMAIGGDHERAHGSVRFTFGRFNAMEEADAAVDAAAEVVARLRAISPLKRKEAEAAR